MFVPKDGATVDWFSFRENEMNRINDGLATRDLTTKDIVSIVYKPETKCYEVWYRKEKGK